MALPTITARIDIKFPAQVTVQSPLILTKTGANYDFSVDVAAILGAGVYVWQLQRALDIAGHYYTVEDSILPALPSNVLYLAWRSGAPKTTTGDSMFDAVEAAVGTAAANAAYSAAQAIIL